MASVTSNATTSSGNLPYSNTAQNNGAGRMTMRTANNAKGAEAGRKQSPGDGSSRRPAPQKAWASGSNPITQRGNMPAQQQLQQQSQQQNGNPPSQPRASSNARPNAHRDVGLSDRHAHDRLSFLFGAAIGLTVVVTSKSGDKFEGLLAGSTLTAANSKITLKMARKSPSATTGQTNGSAGKEAALVGSSPDYAMNFDLRELADVNIPEFSLPEATRLANGSSTGFQTDVDISGNQARGERVLQKWVPEGPESSTDFSLDSGPNSSWDQFATNSQLFGAQSTYDENLYTTVIDRSAPSYSRRAAEAERLAREIESSSATNAHVREERGQALGDDENDDEEEKYSGVRRDNAAFPPLSMGGANKYTPPARRAPTGQPTVPGAPVDPAIISAQISTTDNTTASAQKSPEKDAVLDAEKPADRDQTAVPATQTPQGAVPSAPAAEEAAKPAADSQDAGPTANIESKLFNQFKEFADRERLKVQQQRKAQASQDRAAKLNDLLRFSKTFKLKTPVPNDLIGILAKDPAKQEAIIEKAAKEHQESTPATASPVQAPAVSPSARKPEVPAPIPTMPDRSTFNRGRGGFPQAGRGERPGQSQAPSFPSRNSNGSYPQRFGPNRQDSKGGQPHPIPAPIPIIDGRVPPAGPMADQAGLASPQRSNMHTPTSGKFNLNVKASEFRPNAAAASFNPSVSSQPPSSPASTQRAASISRTASPSIFFGNRKPKPPSERPSIAKDFSPLVRIKEEAAKQEDKKDYGFNGGLPPAYTTGPRWTVKQENDDKTYLEAFERPMVPIPSPAQSRSNSTQQVSYSSQGMPMPNGPANIPHIATPQHGPHFGANNPGVYPSPSLPSRQPSTYGSPMTHPAQLAYPQQPYFNTPNGQMPMQMRPFPGTPGMMHAQIGQMGAPMMVQQPSNGPYMGMPQQFTQQMHMYSPSPGHVYPQQNGYNSPARMAPMMMQQGSQQGHSPAPNMMYSLSSQGGPMGYQQPMGMPRGGYVGHQYGQAPHQGYGMQQRTMSSGYGQIPTKMHPQQMQPTGPLMNGPQGQAFGQMDVQEDAK